MARDFWHPAQNPAMLVDSTVHVPQLLEVFEVARALRISEEAVRRLLRSRKLAAVRFDKRWRVDARVVVAYIEARTITAQTEQPKPAVIFNHQGRDRTGA